MGQITTIAELREAIRLLEIKQMEEERILKEQFMVAYESMKPINMIKNSVKNLIASPDLKNNLFSSTLGLAAGYLSKKAAVGSTHNPIKQLLGTFLQLGVSNVVATNSDGIKSLVMRLIGSYLSKRKASVETEQ